MSAQAAIQLVVGSRSGSAREGRRTIIATTEPQLFIAALGKMHGQSVHVYSRAEPAIAAARSDGCDRFYADFRQLDDGWSGQRLLRFVRKEHPKVEFWLMAEQWLPHQEEWAIKCGAAGMTRRSPHLIATELRSDKPQVPAALQRQLSEIDSVFGRFAGPMRAIHVESARTALTQGQLEANREAYIEFLAACFSFEERRNAFLAAVRTDVSGNGASTSAGDPWMAEVNKVFRQYAGALGATIAIGKAIEALDHRGHYDRLAYMRLLCDGLVNPARRAAFVAAVKAAKLLA